MGTASSEILPDVKKIVVLRPNALGDFIFALPALHALRYAYPQAEITFIGKKWHTQFLHGRPGPIDRVVAMPPYPGVGAELGAQVDQDAIRHFIDRMRAAQFDLAVQLYGGGHYSNPFILRLGARTTIGMKAEGAMPLDRWVSYPRLHNQRLLMLEVAALAGASTLQVGRELELIDRDIEEAAQVVPPEPGQRLAMFHTVATDVRRWWPAERFAAVADALAKEGALIAINGTDSEASSVHKVIENMRYPAVDLSGKLSLSGLTGLFARTSLLVSNDSGPLHLALAIGTPAVGIYWLTNLIDAGPLRQHRHRAAMAMCAHCPVCGAENLTTRCPHDVSFVEDVSVDEVTGLAMDLFKSS